MVRFRNDFGEGRVVPMLGYILIDADQVITVPDGEWEHWDAGGWTALDPRPVPPPEPAAEPDPAPAEAAAPAAARPAKPTADMAPEGTEVA